MITVQSAREVRRGQFLVESNRPYSYRIRTAVGGPKTFRPAYRFFPSGHRCKHCHAPFRPDDHAERAVQAAISIITNVSRMSNELEVGGGVTTGVAFVGNVGGADVPDFTVLGDVVNVAARLQGHPSPREVLLEKSTYQHVKQWYPYIGANYN